MKGQWVIDVCRTCGKLAQAPFCEHRDVGYLPSTGYGPRWYEPVVVHGTWHPAPSNQEGEG